MSRNSFMIEQIVIALDEAGLIPDDEGAAKPFFDALEDHFKDDMVITWCVEDVETICNEEGKLYSYEKAQEILDNVERHIDAEYGVSRETFRDYVSDLPDDPSFTRDDED